LNKLRELIAAEIAKRDDSINMQPALVFVIHDKPGALTDAAAAIAAIVEHAERDDSSPMVCVARSIGDQVADALERKFPKRMIISQPVVGPNDAQRARGRLPIDTDLQPDRAAEAVDRAAERMERIRGNKPTHWAF
jgi:alkanesulfonate monooxygenase SsuD/methylene tetrahydromethanopterin reductase-like flavin-dependent oxidoreductase (luciferase family)